MDEQDHAIHEIRDARARLSELATELARHAQPERVKELAAEKASEWKERAKELAVEKAEELKQQAKDTAMEKATEIKTRAKEAVMQRTTEIKERADTPRGWSLLGAFIGAGVGAALMKKAFDVRQDRYERTDVFRGSQVGSYPTFERADIGSSEVETGADMKARASEAVQSVKDKAYAVKDRALEVKDRTLEQVRDRASNLRERIPYGSDVKYRASDWFDRTLEEQPLLLALGSIALGMLASTLIPVTRRERQLIEPAKRKAQESLSQIGDQLGQKLQEERGNGHTDIVDERHSDIDHLPRAGVSATGGGVGTADVRTVRSDIGFQPPEDMRGVETPGIQSQDRAESLASPTGSRIPPQPPLDDLSTKVH